MGKGKGKKLPVKAIQDDARSSEEEKITLSKKRGRPQKPLKNPLKNDIADEEDQKSVEEEDGENGKVHVEAKDEKTETLMEDGRKRKRSNHVKQRPVKVTDHLGTNIATNDSLKSVGFRQSGSRRKNPPRRAAEVGVQCGEWAPSTSIYLYLQVNSFMNQVAYKSFLREPRIQIKRKSLPSNRQSMAEIGNCKHSCLIYGMDKRKAAGGNFFDN